MRIGYLEIHECQSGRDDLTAWRGAQPPNLGRRNGFGFFVQQDALDDVTALARLWARLMGSFCQPAILMCNQSN
jgi:hypothetical protein